MLKLGKWITVFIDQYGDNNDYNDSVKVMGWLSASLTDGVLTVIHEDGTDNEKTIERYCVEPL